MTAQSQAFLPVSSFANDLPVALRQHPKRIAPKYFYDEIGSALFDRICVQDEYYLTRTELAILQANLGRLCAPLGSRVRVVELGSGSGAKTRPLLDALDAPSEYIPIDV